MRFTTGELARARSAASPSAADRALALELEIFDELVGAGAGSRRADRRSGRGAGAARRRRGAGRARGRRSATCGPSRRRAAPSRSAAAAIRWSRRRCDGQGRPLRRQRLRPRRRQGRLWLVTGPNMAGKSTFLRQNALIAVLAQMGSFVPADAAHIGVVDRLFSRVGAADDLARGRSTFMVEMVETAAILNQADAALAGDPGRDRPRHRDLRRPVDRLGDGRASARGQSLPRAVRHALSRADGAGRPAAALACHTMRVQGMAGRDRLPARGGAGRRRPLLRHPGRQARGPARRP